MPPQSQPQQTAATTTFSTPSASSAGGGAATALQLVRVNPQTGKFELGAEALQALRAVRGPVAVAAVAGRARQGKSSLLNGLLRAAAGANAPAGGFEVGPTTRPTTKGLWIWGSPIQVTDGRTGRRHTLILVDSEGIDATDVSFSFLFFLWCEEFFPLLLASFFLFHPGASMDGRMKDLEGDESFETLHIKIILSQKIKNKN